MSAYGCFTTVRVEDGGVRGWSEHLRRLVRDTTMLFDRPVTEGEVGAAVHGALAGAARPVLLRIAVVARDHTLNHPGGTDLVVEVTARAADAAGPLRVLPIAHRRMRAEVKHLGITADLIVRRQAQQAGYDDALYLSEDRVTEGPTWSLVARIGDELVSPTGGLPSVTLGLLCRTRPISIRRVGADELVAVSDAVAVNAGWGVRPVSAIEGREMAGALGEQLAAAYAGIAAEPL